MVDGYSAAGPPILRARGLRKSYGKIVALGGVDLDIERGEVVGLLGPNGAGKTTLISLIAGLRRPDAGTVQIGGIDNREDPRSMIGIAPQELGIYLQLTVLKNLRFFGELSGLSGRQRDTRIDAVVAALELEELLPRKAHELSGGEKRRLHAAIAILHEPPLLLLDEPTAGADVETRNRLLELVRALARAGTAICYSTHYLAELENVADAVLILDHGSAVARGRLKDLIAASGKAVVEVRLDGPLPPQLASRGSADHDSSVVRIEAHDPGAELTSALALMGDSIDRVRSIEIVQPSLESVYLSLTGRRFDLDRPTSHAP